jgi:hypothetical protein
MKIEKRYLTNWSYNAARIFDHLEKIVHNNGGVLVSEWGHNRPRTEYEIVNRQLLAAIQEKEEFVEKLERLNRPAAQAERAKLEEWKSIDNSPVKTYYADYMYISFMLNNTYYYYQVDRNPFFEFFYKKIPAPGGKMDRNHYMDHDKKEWLYDCFFSWDCSDVDRKEAANMIFNMLMNARHSVKARGKSRPVELHALQGETE